MARSLSIPARRAIFASQTGEAFLLLLRLAHGQLPDTIRVTSDGQDTVSRGQTYQPFPFDITMPAEAESGPVQVTLQICNVDRRIVEAVRSVQGDPVQVSLEVVLASSPDLVEAGPFDFSLRDVTYDALVVQGTLRFEDVLNEPYPADTFSPARFPGLF